MEDKKAVEYNLFVYKDKVSENDLGFVNSICEKALKGELADKFPALSNFSKEPTEGIQVHIPKTLLGNLIKTIEKCAHEYVSLLSKGSHEVKSVNALDFWAIEQRANDFNPVHNHSGTLSGVLYLKYPEELKNDEALGGRINFFFDRLQPESLNFLGVRSYVPSEGELILFPSWMPHAVYPFKDDNIVRRIIAFNFDLAIEAVKK